MPQRDPREAPGPVAVNAGTTRPPQAWRQLMTALQTTVPRDLARAQRARARLSRVRR